MAIVDDVFDSGLKDVKEICQIEIPPQMNIWPLKLRKTKMDLPIFRRPGCQINQSQNQMIISRDLYNEAVQC
jgi:hypothetical protein